MVSADPATLAARLTRLAAPPTDADLLARYVAGRDGEAFAELVRRHGPTVLAVCRRVTTHTQDAEDAFQATFLVLARKAARVRLGEPLGAWLYGVAVRAARKAAGRAGRREVVGVPDVPARMAEPFDPDAARAVAEEVERLPAWYRVVVVLCELEGRSRAAAARELGIAEGTLSSRLAKARKRLAARLAARGFGPAALAGLAGVAVPPGLAAAASALATGGPAPAAIAALSQGVLHAMFLRKLKVVSLAATVVASAAVLAAVSSAGPTDPPRPADAPRPAPVRVATDPPAAGAKADRPGALVVVRDRVFWQLDPDGKKLGEIPLPAQALVGGRVALSPDGTRVALTIVSDEPPRPQTPEDIATTPWPFKILIRPAAGAGELRDWEVVGRTVDVRWMPGGKALAVTLTSLDGTAYTHQLLDPDTGTRRPLGLPGGCRILDVARDGAAFLVEHREAGGKGASLALAAPGEAVVRPLTPLATPPGVITGRISPDGKAVLFTDGDPTRKDAHKWDMSHRPFVLNLETRRRETLAGFPEDGRVGGVAWSPDGKRVAYTWARPRPDLLAKDKDDLTEDAARVKTDAFLTVADADGRNARAVASDAALWFGGVALGAIDWR